MPFYPLEHERTGGLKIPPAWRSWCCLEDPTCLCVSIHSLSWDRLSMPTKFWWEMMLSAFFSQGIAEMIKPFSSSLELVPQQWISYNSHGSHSPLLFWWWLCVCRTMAQGAGTFDYFFFTVYLSNKLHVKVAHCIFASWVSQALVLSCVLDSFFLL